MARAQYGENSARIGRLDIRAPASGLILSRNVEPGQVVGGGGTVLFRIAKGGEIVLAGFYSGAVSFAFPPAFMKEARFRVAAEWTRDDLIATRGLVESGNLNLGGLITHQMPANKAADAYPVAFDDARCLKMILDRKGHT